MLEVTIQTKHALTIVESCLIHSSRVANIMRERDIEKIINCSSDLTDLIHAI